MKRSYSTDLTDAEWECLRYHLPPPNKRGRPTIHSTREILDAVFYVLKSGCPWRLLPREFPPWETVYCWLRKWRIEGTSSSLRRRCESDYESLRAGKRARARGSSILSQPRRPRWALSRGDTTVERRCAVGSDICWWIQKVSS